MGRLCVGIPSVHSQTYKNVNVYCNVGHFEPYESAQ